MKVFLAVLFVALVGVTQALRAESKEKIIGIHKICFPKTEVTKEQVDQMRAGEFVDDDKLKAYVQCMFIELGFMNKDGELQVDYIKSQIPEDVDHDKALALIEKCKEVKSDPKGKAYEVYKCYRKSTTNPIHL